MGEMLRAIGWGLVASTEEETVASETISAAS